MYDTATKAQFIDLRAKGWSLDKISRHTGINPSTLTRWNREFAEDIASLKFDYLAAGASWSHGASAEAPDGAAQESYFHNLEGYPQDPNPKSKIQNPKCASRRRRVSGFKRRVRKFLRSPIVRAAVRYAVFKR